MIYAAEFTNGSKTRSATLDLNVIDEGRRSTIFTHTVSGKREARQIAKARGFQCWNF